MKTYHQVKNWIWQSEAFPNFVFKKLELEHIYYRFGQLNMIEKFISSDDTKALFIDMLSNEAIATSAIEGEILQRSSVHSSINKILRLGLDEDYGSTVQSDAIVEITIDAKQNANEPLSKQRLCGWHKALFPMGQSGLRKIRVGEYRTGKEDMKIVSGAWEKEKLHYIAPPSILVEELMSNFLIWLNSKNEKNIFYKASIAHLWFVLIHPFDDGNGRIARAITDFVLASGNMINANFYSISTVIHNRRKQYYTVLDSVCKQIDLDISLWMEWFIFMLEASIDEALVKLESIQKKAKFWDKHRDTKLNERQKKVINKMLLALPNHFEGGMRVQKYTGITKTTRITASRDLADLVEKAIMKKIGNGRGVYYELIFS
jgi:Fic family protein